MNADLSPRGDDLGPSGDLHLVAAALRADQADVASYTRLLSEVLGDVLPHGMVEIERKRSLADRMNGREGAPVALTVTTADERLTLRQEPHGVTGEIHQVVRGVTIKRRVVSLDEWLVALAGVLYRLAEGSAAARAALSGLLGQ